MIFVIFSTELQELLLTKFPKWKWIKMAYFDRLPKLWWGTWNKHRPILVLDKSCMWLRYTQLWAKMRQQWNNHMVSLEVANDLSPNITKCLSQNIYHKISLNIYHQKNITNKKSLNIYHKICITKYVSPNDCHQQIIAKYLSPKKTHLVS